MGTFRWFRAFGILAVCLGSANMAFASAKSGAGGPELNKRAGSEMQGIVGASATVAPSTCRGKTAPTVNAKVRSGPGTAYGVIGNAKKCEAIVAAGRNAANDWLQISTGGWISRSLVTNAPSGLPVVSAPAPPVAAPLKVVPIVVAPTAVPAVPTAVPIVPTAVPPTAVPPTEVPPAPPTAVPAPVAQCDSNYSGVCVPLVSYDLDCKDIGAKRFQSTGSDPHGLDRDKDGLACE